MNNFEQELDRLSHTRFKYRNENLDDGNRYNETQRRAEELFRIETGFKTIPANLHGPSCLDGFLVHEGQFRAGYEIKSRNYTFKELERLGDFLLTQDKVVRCIETCKNLCIPFITICYSIPDDKIRFWFVSNDKGKTTRHWKFNEKFSYGGVITNAYNFPHNQSFNFIAK